MNAVLMEYFFPATLTPNENVSTAEGCAVDRMRGKRCRAVERSAIPGTTLIDSVCLSVHVRGGRSMYADAKQS